MCPEPALLPRAEPGLGSVPGSLCGALCASTSGQTCHLAGSAFVLGDSRPEAVTDAISRAREEVPRGDLSCPQSAASPGFWGRRLEVLCRSITSVHLNLELRLSRTGGHGAVQQVMEKPPSPPLPPGATAVTVGEACICGNREGPAERVRAPCGLLEDQGGALQRERTVCLARALSRPAGLIQV